MTPNRIAALLAALAPVVSAIVAFVNGIHSLYSALIVIVALLCVTWLAIVYLLGWQKHEARAFNAAARKAIAPAAAVLREPPQVFTSPDAPAPATVVPDPVGTIAQREAWANQMSGGQR